ncbi:MAG: hypothetical protein AB7P17_04190 [Nitrospirales bacterium]
MTVKSPLESLSIPEECLEHFQAYLKDLEKTFQRNLEAVILYGSAARGDFVEGRSNWNLLVLVRSLPVTLIQEAGKLHKKGEMLRIVPPLLMTLDELHQSCSVYPLELLLIKESHVLLEGRDPFPGLQLSLEHLGWHCEREIRSHVIQVRQRFMEGEARSEAVQSIMVLSITALLPFLRGILRVLNHSSQGTDMEILERLPHVFHYQSTGLLDALKLKRGLRGPGALEWFKVYEQYLNALMELIACVQKLRAEGRL